MINDWHDLIAGDRWCSPATVWVEDGIEYSWARVGELASAVNEAIREYGPARVVRIQSDLKLGCFAGQLGAWRAGCVAVADDGSLGPGEIDRVQPELTLTVSGAPSPAVGVAGRAGQELASGRIPAEVAAVNFTSGSTGSRKAVAVTRGNLLALFRCRDLDVPTDGRLAAGSFAAPVFDGWWFDTWRTVAEGGTVACLPGVNEDVFEWPEIAGKYQIDRLLLPAAVIAAIVESVPGCLAGIPWVFSGGEQFRASTWRQARRAGLANRFVNLYGPTEATFATHRYDLPRDLAAPDIPIGKPLAGCQQVLGASGEGGARELVVQGPFVCLGYLEDGVLTRRFRADGRPSYRTGDLVRADDEGNMVFAGRLDSQIKVNGTRVDAAAVERQVTAVPGVRDCRVGQDPRRTVAFVRADSGAARARAGAVVREFSPAISVQFVDRFPVKAGGKVDISCLLQQQASTEGN